ncbi:tautomerase family protein [Paenibacillus mendelii]|uniref:4-oxalocrotonate tautomerase family protein n=1 Tax=Paenibacillus mendelii TaxID=206163 RepID=A0ABV6JAJ5_9BACL|nr:tautomerase family protein [Paenibacillus mendelii]MCQ6560688.1 tautomerase family protein [Paenibacillus mendelii]
MPAIAVTMKTRSIESRKKIAQGITEVIVRETGVDPEWITIHFYETDEERVARGGVMLSDRTDKTN